MGRKGLFRAGPDLDGGFGSSTQISHELVQVLLSHEKALFERALEPKGYDVTYLGKRSSGGSCVRAAFSTLAGSWAMQTAQNLSWTGVGLLCPCSNHIRACLDLCLPGHTVPHGGQARAPTPTGTGSSGPYL